MPLLIQVKTTENNSVILKTAALLGEKTGGEMQKTEVRFHK